MWIYNYAIYTSTSTVSAKSRSTTSWVNRNRILGIQYRNNQRRPAVKMNSIPMNVDLYKLKRNPVMTSSSSVPSFNVDLDLIWEAHSREVEGTEKLKTSLLQFSASQYENWFLFRMMPSFLLFSSPEIMATFAVMNQWFW